LIDPWLAGYELLGANAGEQILEEAGRAVGKLWAAVCCAFAWRCRCPRCGEEMVRTLAFDRSYVYEKRTTIRVMNIGRGKSYVYRALHRLLRIRITPIRDVCKLCGHHIRRGTTRTPL
jgi:hypothetical protein